MFFKKKNSILQKALLPFEGLMETWEKKRYCDELIEEITYYNGKISIVFQEDLREHIVNFKILHPELRLINICYRQCLYYANELIIDELLNSLKSIGNQNNKEFEEVTIYFQFLKTNKIL